MKRFVILVIITAISIAFIMNGMNQGKKKMHSVEVMATVVQDVTNSVSCNGKVEAKQTYSISVPYTGVVDAIGIKTGDTVKNNAYLFTASSITNDTYLEYGIDDYLSNILSNQNILNEYLNTGKLPDNLFSAQTVSAFAGNAEEAIDYYAPSDGLVTAVNIHENGLVLPGIACVSIADVSTLKVTASVPEEYAYLIKIGQRAIITVKGANTKVKGTVKEIMPYAHQTGSILSTGETVVDVVISIDEYGLHIIPGLSASVKIITETRKDAITVPYEALLQDEEDNLFLYIADNGVARKKYVLTGIEMDNRVEILTGLEEPAYVLLNPPETLSDGMEIACILAEGGS